MNYLPKVITFFPFQKCSGKFSRLSRNFTKTRQESHTVKPQVLISCEIRENKKNARTIPNFLPFFPHPPIPSLFSQALFWKLTNGKHMKKITKDIDHYHISLSKFHLCPWNDPWNSPSPLLLSFSPAPSNSLLLSSFFVLSRNTKDTVQSYISLLEYNISSCSTKHERLMESFFFGLLAPLPNRLHADCIINE